MSVFLHSNDSVNKNLKSKKGESALNSQICLNCYTFIIKYELCVMKVHGEHRTTYFFHYSVRKMMGEYSKSTTTIFQNCD